MSQNTLEVTTQAKTNYLAGNVSRKTNNTANTETYKSINDTTHL